MTDGERFAVQFRPWWALFQAQYMDLRTPGFSWGPRSRFFSDCWATRERAELALRTIHPVDLKPDEEIPLASAARTLEYTRDSYNKNLADAEQRAAMWEGSAKKLDADLKQEREAHLATIGEYGAKVERLTNAHAETAAALAAYKVRCERLTALLRQEYDGNEDALCAIQETAEEMENASDELTRLARLLKGVRNSFASADEVAAAIGGADQ